MKAITYRNTKTTLPGWVPSIHETWSRGFAYELTDRFIHVFGFDKNLWTICDVVAAEAKQGSLEDWVKNVFGADDILDVDLEVGHTIKGVWRPGLFFDTHMEQGLAFTAAQLRLAEQSLLLLVQRLDELLLFVEPSATTLSSFSHKARELLILACTECENYWQDYLREATHPPANSRTYTTNDYVRLLNQLHLAEFELSMPRYSNVGSVHPFDGWSASNPTQSLSWYDDYNKAKHDRTTHFSSATLFNCIKAVSGVIIMFSVRFGPYRLTTGSSTLASSINHLFSIALVNPQIKSFYVPLVKRPEPTQLHTMRLQDVWEPMAVEPFHV